MSRMRTIRPMTEADRDAAIAALREARTRMSTRKP